MSLARRILIREHRRIPKFDVPNLEVSKVDMGRAEADITNWVEYFVSGMAISFEKVLHQMQEADNKGLPDTSSLLRTLDPKQRKAIEFFKKFKVITSSQIGELFGFKPRTSAKLCADWVNQEFLKIVDSSNNGRKYALNNKYIELII